jgi:hypothetical protein
MSTYNLIQDGESGLSVRTTLNDLLTAANSGFTQVFYQLDTNTFPTGSVSGDILLVTSDGTSGGTVSQEWIYNGGGWTEITAGSSSTEVYYQSNTNTFPTGSTTGDFTFITNDGTSGGTVTQQYIYDGNQWKDFTVSGSTSCVTTPVYEEFGNQSTFTLSNTPLGPITVFNNGVQLPENEYSISGETVTISNTITNLNVRVLYFYSVCSSLIANSVSYGENSDPSSFPSGVTEGSVFFVTQGGLETNPVLEQWIYDGLRWKEVSTGGETQPLTFSADSNIIQGFAVRLKENGNIIRTDYVENTSIKQGLFGTSGDSVINDYAYIDSTNQILVLSFINDRPILYVGSVNTTTQEITFSGGTQLSNDARDPNVKGVIHFDVNIGRALVAYKLTSDNSIKLVSIQKTGSNYTKITETNTTIGTNRIIQIRMTSNGSDSFYVSARNFTEKIRLRQINAGPSIITPNSNQSDEMPISAYGYDIIIFVQNTVLVTIYRAGQTFYNFWDADTNTWSQTGANYLIANTTPGTQPSADLRVFRRGATSLLPPTYYIGFIGISESVLIKFNVNFAALPSSVQLLTNFPTGSGEWFPTVTETRLPSGVWVQSGGTNAFYVINNVVNEINLPLAFSGLPTEDYTTYWNTTATSGFFADSVGNNYGLGFDSGNTVNLYWDDLGVISPTGLPIIGIAQQSGTTGSLVEVAVENTVSTVQTGLTPSFSYYANSNGSLSLTGETYMGIALSPTELNLSFGNSGMSGTSGTSGTSGVDATNEPILFESFTGITQGRAVRLGEDGLIYPCDFVGVENQPIIGIAQTSGDTSEIIEVAIEGQLSTTTSGLTPSFNYYASSDGSISLTGETYIGTAIKSDTIQVQFSNPNGVVTPSLSVIDNTITDPVNITVPGRYIVPSSGVTGSFIGEENDYADYDGTDFTFIVPTNNDKAVITTGPNAGNVYLFTSGATSGWTLSSQSTTLPTSNWVSGVAYKQFDLVIYQNFLYQANSNIPANTAFNVGTSGATWKPINNGVVAEYGESVMPSNVTLTNNTQTTLLTASIPSAGVWEIEYSLNIDANNGSTNDGGSFWINDSNGNEVANSGQIFYMTSSSNGASTLSRKITVTTSGPTTYTVRGWKFSNVGATVAEIDILGGGVMSTTQATISGGIGTSKVSWNKIGGFAPVVGQVSNITFINSTSGQPGAGTADIDYNTGARFNFNNSQATLTTNGVSVGTNIVTVTQPGTYRVQASYTATDNGGNPTSYEIQMGVNGVAYGLPTRGTAQTSSNLQITLFNLVNLNAGDVIDIRHFNGSTSESININPRFTLSVEQIGTTNTSAFTGVISPSWNISNSYPLGTIVVNNSLLYQANSFIAANTAFTVGTTGATWRLVSAASSTGDWIDAGTVQSVGIQGTLVNPTIPTNTIKNRIYYRQVGPKTWEVQGMLNYTNNAGGANGTGDYLFTLPAGLTFNGSLQSQTFNQTSVGISDLSLMGSSIPGSNFMMISNTTITSTTPGVLPWDSTRYRLILRDSAVVRSWGGGTYQIMFDQERYSSWSFTFQTP